MAALGHTRPRPAMVVLSAPGRPHRRHPCGMTPPESSHMGGGGGCSKWGRRWQLWGRPEVAANGAASDHMRPRPVKVVLLEECQCKLELAGSAGQAEQPVG